MGKLSRKEKSEILKLSERFIGIHQELFGVEEALKNMSKRSESLLMDLEKCREDERRFINDLSNKYGDGVLDPFSLSWEKKVKNGIS
jgi:hypothetical protein